MAIPSLPITIRLADADDQIALQRLAALDSAPAPPDGPLLLAEVDGRLRAALALADGTAIADPFHRTAELLELLRAHASAQAGGRADASGRLSRWTRRVRPVAPRGDRRAPADPAARGLPLRSRA